MIQKRPCGRRYGWKERAIERNGMSRRAQKRKGNDVECRARHRNKWERIVRKLEKMLAKCPKGACFVGRSCAFCAYFDGLCERGLVLISERLGRACESSPIDVAPAVFPLQTRPLSVFLLYDLPRPRTTLFSFLLCSPFTYRPFVITLGIRLLFSSF